MDEGAFKRTLADNLLRLRKASGLTQAELGEKIHYSDKSISKWERGEGAPDLFVVMRLCELYGVTPNEITGASAARRDKSPEKPAMTRTLFLLILESALWLAALLIFSAFLLVAPGLSRKWLVFVYALPAAFACPGACFLKWKLYWWAYGALCLCGWTLCVCLHLTPGGPAPAAAYIAGSAAQLLSLLVLGARALRGKMRG